MLILITGGAGFIGSHLSERLLENNNSVIVVDNLYTGSEDNIKHLYDNENFKFVRKDICDLSNQYYNDYIFPLFEKHVERIYHLASPASPTQYMKDPLYTLDTNYIGTRNVLSLAEYIKMNHINIRVLFASTSEVYGDPTEHPQTEKYFGNVNCFGPRACYDEGKRIGETLCYEYIKNRNLNVKIARIFNTYGERMQIDDGRVVSNFINAALNGKDITVHGDGEQTRSFQYIEDLINGLSCLMESNVNEPVNFGNPDERTIKSFAILIKQFVRSKSNIVYNNDINIMNIMKDNPKRRKPDISLAFDLFEWKPRFTTFYGLSRTIEYFRNLL